MKQTQTMMATATTAAPSRARAMLLEATVHRQPTVPPPQRRPQLHPPDAADAVAGAAVAAVAAESARVAIRF